jgi:hypothetical protein
MTDNSSESGTAGLFWIGEDRRGLALSGKHCRKPFREWVKEVLANAVAIPIFGIPDEVTWMALVPHKSA